MRMEIMADSPENYIAEEDLREGQTMEFRYFYTHHATDAKFLEIQVFPDMD